MAYANGPGYQKPTCDIEGNCNTRNERYNDTTNFDFRFPAHLFKYSDTHGMEDVPLYAEGTALHTTKLCYLFYPSLSFQISGPFSFMFHKTHEQTYIGHAIPFALCIGQYKNETHCNPKSKTSTSGASSATASAFMVIILSIVRFLNA